MRRIFKSKVTKAEQFIHPSVPKGGGGRYFLTLVCGHTKVLKASVWAKNTTGYVHCRDCQAAKYAYV